jgi:hypothetical protein
MKTLEQQAKDLLEEKEPYLIDLCKMQNKLQTEQIKEFTEERVELIIQLSERVRL